MGLYGRAKATRSRSPSRRLPLQPFACAKFINVTTGLRIRNFLRFFKSSCSITLSYLNSRCKQQILLDREVLHTPCYHFGILEVVCRRENCVKPRRLFSHGINSDRVVHEIDVDVGYVVLDKLESLSIVFAEEQHLRVRRPVMSDDGFWSVLVEHYRGRCEVDSPGSDGSPVVPRDEQDFVTDVGEHGLGQLRTASTLVNAYT